METKLEDLNQYLFMQLERLSAENMDKDEVNREVKKANAIQVIAGRVIDSNKLEFEAIKFQSTFIDKFGGDVPEFNFLSDDDE